MHFCPECAPNDILREQEEIDAEICGECAAEHDDPWDERYDEDGNYIPDLVYDGVGFVPAEVAAAAFAERERRFELEDAAAAAAAAAAEPEGRDSFEDPERRNDF